MLHAALEVRSSPIQSKGLFARCAIAVGEVIWTKDPTDPRYRRSEIATWSAEQQAYFLRWSFQIDDDLFAGPRSPADLDDSDQMNHSCDPNCCWSDQSTMVARRAIASGEEVTFDYATSEARPEFSFSCSCGTALCRGLLQGEDYLRRPELRARYGAQVQPFLLRWVAARAARGVRGGGTTLMLHPAIELRPSPTAGYGLFATGPIAANALIWRGDSDGPLFHRDTIAAMPPLQREFYHHFAYQVDDDLFSAPPLGTEPETADYMNHSCDPTVWFVDPWTIVARRAIAAGDEITYDYATSESSPDFGFEHCNCGTALCRGTIGSTDYVDSPTLQERYGDHVLPYLRRRLAARQAEQATVGV
jgi:uncharacterized protein